jgi:PKD repeat protein
MMRMLKKTSIVMACCLILLLFQSGAAAIFDNIDGVIEIKEIDRGQTIFFGEENLDVTRCMGDYGWVVAWDGVNNVTDSIEIRDPSKFTIPTDKDENVWYLSPDGINPDPAFIVAFVSQEPKLDFNVWNADTDTLVDESKSAYRGNSLRFKFTVDTNLDKITERPNYPGAYDGYINIAVTSPDGEQLLELMTLTPEDLTFDMESLLELDVQDSPAWIWPDNIQPAGKIGWWTNWRNANAGQESDYRYKLGSYNVVAVCNVNNMFKNKPVQRATWQERSFELEARPLTVEINALEAGRDKQFTATVRGLPATKYQLFIFDECPPKITGKVCDRPPFIIGDRTHLASRGIVLDPEVGPYPIGAKDVIDCCKDGMKIREMVPSGDAYPSAGNPGIVELGTRYYAEVTTGPEGTATVPFWVDTTINSGTFTIQVQDVDYQQKATAPVPVTMGSITASVKSTSGVASSTFFIGDELWIDGTNTDSNASYIWITGPGLEPCGVNLFDLTSSDPVRAAVFDSKNGQSNYWRISPNWATNDTPISAGEYTIWIASSNPDGWACTPATCFGIAEEKGICAIQKCPSCAVWTSIPITLVQPELTVEPIDDVKRCCCPGYPCGLLGGIDEIWIKGTSGGNNCKELQVWMFSQSQFGTKNYLFTVTPTYCDDTFAFELNKGLLQTNGIDLCQLATGMYEVIVQAPGANGMFDIGIGAAEANMDRFVTSTLPVSGSKVFKIEGKDALSNGVAVKYLKDGLNKQGIDDKYAYVTFNLEDKSCEGNVDFSADRTNGNSPLTVQFTDKSVMDGVSWAWSSNGILFSTEQNPRNTFTTPGKYSIRLEVTDENGLINSAVKDSYITVLSSPVADFSYGPTPAGKNDLIQFTDQSTGAPTSWMWNFGDGNSSSLQSPSHAYPLAGTYTVTLSVGNAFGASAPVSKEITIVNDKAVVDFVGVPTSSAFFPATISFTDLSTGVYTAWQWEFIKNGVITSTSTDKNPTITFNEPGIYDVTLRITNNGGTSSLTKTGYITIGTGSTINLAPGYNHVSVPRAVTTDFNTIGKLFAGVDTAGIPFAIYGDDNGMTNWTNVSTDYLVQPLEAFRVYSTTEKVITPDYLIGGVYNRGLSAGWAGNGIGIMAMQPTPANVALASLGDAWERALAFNAKTQRWEVLITRGVDDDKTMDPTVGYILEMNKDGVLVGGEV